MTETVLQDVRYAARMLYRDRAFNALAVLALTLGIGVNTAVFTAYKAMVARALDARDPGKMVNLALRRDSGAAEFRFSYPDYAAYRDAAHSFSGLIAFTEEHLRFLTAGGMVSQHASAAGSDTARSGLPSPGMGNAEFAFVSAVSENYFQVLGVAPLSGRTFDSMSPLELRASPAVLISENSWRRRFGGDPAVVGKTIRLNGAVLTIVGITPHDFVGTGIGVPDFWLPLSLEPLVHADESRLQDRENLQYRLFGRLAPGVNSSRAAAEMSILAVHVRALHDPQSESAKHATFLVWPGSPFPLPLKFYRGLVLTILLVMLAAGMVLVVACANVASLQLARAKSRQDELRIRLALGASRTRLIRQLLTESALLGLLSGVLALLFTWALLKALVMLAAQVLPADAGTLIFQVNPDLQIFIYVFAISLLAGTLFGLAPAVESSRSALHSSIRGSSQALRSRRMQDLLVGAQVALSSVLVVAGSMLIRSSMESLKAETGYDSKHVIDVDLQFPEAPKYTSLRKASLVHELRRRLAALPGVAAITSARPPDENSFRTAAVLLSGERSSEHNVQSVVHYTYVQANYFQTLKIPLLLGRGFPSQGGGPEHSVVLSDSAARQLLPGKNLLGRSIRLGVTDERSNAGSERLANGLAFQVVGVARDTRGVEFDGSDSKQAYLLLPEEQIVGHPILIRAKSDPASIKKAIDPVVAAIDPDLIATPATLDEMLRQTAPFIGSSMAAVVASTIGLFGLLLASMGIYGTVSYIVVQRTREIGIRMAIGAQRRDVLGLVLRESIRPVLAGLSLGMFLAVGNTYLLRSLLYERNGIDGVSFGVVFLLFSVIGLLAAYPPSRRAMSVDPMVALRYE